MKITITCEDCGERHQLARRVSGPGPIWIVCHACELPLRAVFEGDAASPTQTHSVWAGIIDLGAGVPRTA